MHRTTNEINPNEIIASSAIRESRTRDNKMKMLNKNEQQK